jgi:hypothetical protein
VKTFVGLFLSSAVFGASISIIYWFSSHEYAGTLLLGFMFCGLAFAALYAMLAEREAQIDGDDKALRHKEVAGEDVGIFTKESPWPPLLALSILWFLIGLIWSDFMLFTGVVAMLLCLWRLGAESARTGHKRLYTEEGPEDVQ